MKTCTLNSFPSKNLITMKRLIIWILSRGTSSIYILHPSIFISDEIPVEEYDVMIQCSVCTIVNGLKWVGAMSNKFGHLSDD